MAVLPHQIPQTLEVMEFDDNKPIYIQIADNITGRILSGELKPGERIPSVREWGGNIGVNPNTVARSYELLSNRGIIFNQRGIGFFISANALEIISSAERTKFIQEEIPAFMERARLLGIDLKQYLQ